jgi:hypothetical protein
MLISFSPFISLFTKRESFTKLSSIFIVGFVNNKFGKFDKICVLLELLLSFFSAKLLSVLSFLLIILILLLVLFIFCFVFASDCFLIFGFSLLFVDILSFSFSFSFLILKGVFLFLLKLLLYNFLLKSSLSLVVMKGEIVLL